MKIKSSSCSVCGSTNYYCKGLCKKCYTKQLIPIRWAKNFDCCQNCHSTDRFHVAKGLCYKCYNDVTDGTLCQCGCGLQTSRNKKFVHGHWANTKANRNPNKSAGMMGNKNPQWGKFGSDHPAYGHKTSDEVRELRRKTRLDYMSSHNNNPTSIEIILSRLLDDLGINHITQCKLHDKFVVDEFLPDYNIIIEAYGSYWHGDSRRFPTPSKLQISNIKKDLSRQAYLTKCGHSILILWEKEINEVVDWCKLEINVALGKNFGFPFIQDSIQGKS